jgi:hypothetical protein
MQATREDLFHRAWNYRLLEEIVKLFSDNLEGFLRHETLRYQWVRYLPTHPVSDEFWEFFQRNLLEMLKTREAFISRTGLIRKPGMLRILTGSFKDDSGEPLLPECHCLDHKVWYLAQEYTAFDVPILHALGVGIEQFSDIECIDFLDCDLRKSISLLDTVPADSTWQTKLANILLRALDNEKLSERVRNMRLIRLRSGRRSKLVLHRRIYFPSCNGIDIPHDLALNLVDPHALIDQSRLKLFCRLGVSDCHPSTVLKQIQKASSSDAWSLANSVEHIKFVYWNHAELDLDNIRLAILSTDLQLLNPQSDMGGWVYSPTSTSEYGAAQVLDYDPMAPCPEELLNAVRFVHPKYYEVLESCEQRQNKSGAEWLNSYFGIKTIPQLQGRTPPGLTWVEVSSEVRYIVKKKPHLLFGVLKQSWRPTPPDTAWQTEFKKLNVKIPIIGLEESKPLNSVFLPHPRLKVIATMLGFEHDLGFVKELENMNDDDASGWSFLRCLNIGTEDNFDFWAALLRKGWERKTPDRQAIAKIYSHLMGHFPTPAHENALR